MTVHVGDWVNTLRATPDPRGDIVVKLRRYRGLPGRFPNCRHFYDFVKLRLKLTHELQLRAVPSLYREYLEFTRRIATAGHVAKVEQLEA